MQIALKKSETARRRYRLKCGGLELELGERTFIMGIVNVTPDSFSDGGVYLDADKAAERVLNIQEAGADIVDIGGESTRPGSMGVTAEEEILRLEPVMKMLRGKMRVPVSVDTSKSEVAEMALRLGAAIINDVTALRGDGRMADVVRRHDACVVLMHMNGEPRTMQIAPAYEDVVEDVIKFFRERIDFAVDAGIKRDKIVIDPGIGFGKTLEDNLKIIKRLRDFEALSCPLLIGTSRKSFIGNILDKEPEGRLYGTVASCVRAVREGAHILRVHDVREVKEAVLVEDRISGA
ncbi:MAG: dihydropteroate synthase [Candidatus Omnitrophica bacterium CG1_02_49_10]|nr:MAG: dihydropteroate synthase [Candidatus Omnitrophica bacterium CG1_02_49_10]